MLYVTIKGTIVYYKLPNFNIIRDGYFGKHTIAD